MTANRQWQLARRPTGSLPEEADFRLVTAEAPNPGPNQLLARTLYLSLDPYQWGRRRGGTEAVGEVCHGRTVSQVVASNHPDYSEGEFIFNTNGWQEYGLTGEGISVFNYMFPRKLDPSLAPISTAIGVLGMLGLTAWSGIRVQCKPQPGETVVVSAASGGVGQCAGQIAKILGARVVGVAGREEKCDFVTEVLGFDACVSHLSDTLGDELAAACPDGIDVYYENVGGKVFEAVAPLLVRGSRITICGMIAQYASEHGNARETWMRIGQPHFERQGTEVHSLFVGNFVEQYEAEFLAQMSGWVTDGLIKYKEDLWPGLEQAPIAFRAMMEGGNFGKTLVAVGDDPTLDDFVRERRRGTDVIGRAG